MKIAYFIDTLPPHYDGVVKTMCHLIETLQSEKIDFIIFSSFKPDNQFDWADQVHKVISVPFIFYRDYRLGLPYFQGIHQKLDEFKPDLIHAVGPTLLSLYGIRYAQKRKIKTVASYHTNFISYFPYYKMPKILEKFALFLQNRFYNRCDRVYVPSNHALEELRSLGIKKIEVWKRGINLDIFSPENKNDDIRKSINANDHPILLYVGRLVKEKDLNDLIAAHSILKKNCYEYKLVLVGDGPMRMKLQRKAPDAHFTGFLSGKELAEWYASSDLLVFPSTTETFGNVILEAFASGIPAIVVNKGGVTDIINNGKNGLIAKANSPRDFVEKIEFLLKDTSGMKRMGEVAKESAKNRSWQSVNLALLRSYEKVLSS
jgi:glycosyltransferase involved in cell wall biosynthesis